MTKILTLVALSVLIFAAVANGEVLTGKLSAESKQSFTDQKTRTGVFADPDWYNWGASVIKADDGKYHMFYARWAKRYTFRGWLVRSEVAHAVADDPLGPWKYVDTALKMNTDNFEQITAHNPKIKKFDGKYYLYYIATHGITEEAKLTELSTIGYAHKQWMPIRNLQRTRVAVAETLNGPWKRLPDVVVEPAKTIKTLTVNPAITQGPDGTYFMVVKGDKPGTDKFIRNQALATSKKPEGPFEIYHKAVIDTFDTEDASMWYDKTAKRFYAVFHAHNYIGLITSKDGYNWEKAQDGTLTKKEILFDDNTTIKPDRMERPFVLTDESGKAIVLYAAVKKGDFSCNVQIPLTEKVGPKKDSKKSKQVQEKPTSHRNPFY